MIYKSKFLGETFESFFLYEEELGSFLICKSLAFDVRIPKEVSLDVSNGIITIEAKEKNNYWVC